MTKLKEPKDLKATHRLSDLNIIELAIADAPAVPDGKFVVLKAKDIDLPEGAQIILKHVTFKAVNKVKKQVFGYCLVPEVPDHQGDIVSGEGVEKAAHGFMQNAALHKTKGEGTSDNHYYFDGIGYVCESTIDYYGVIGKAAGMDEGIKGGWWVGVQIENDALWDQIEKGEKTGFSIGGTGVRKPVDGAKDNSAVGKVLDKITDLYGRIRKADGKSFQEIYQARQVQDDLWDMFFALQDSITTIIEDSDITDKVAAVNSTMEQFRTAIIAFVSVIKAGAGNDQEATNQDVAKQLSEIIKKLSNDSTEDPEGGTDVDAKQLAQLVSTVEGIQKTVDEKILPTLKKFEEDPAAADPNADPNATKDDDEALTKVLEKVDALQKSITNDVLVRLEKLEKTPSIRKGQEPAVTTQQEPKTEPVKKNEALKGAMFGGMTRPVDSEA